MTRAEPNDGLRITREHFARPADELAPWLLGARLVRILPDGTRLAGTIIETEAYLAPEDRASHAYSGRRTQRNEAMYALAGTAYVYFTYGMHHCFNIAAGHHNLGQDCPHAVLIRALEPTEGLAAMHALRTAASNASSPPPPTTTRWLTSGPAKLCQALAIDRTTDKTDLTTSQTLFFEHHPAGPITHKDTLKTPRVGLGNAGVWANKPLRWLISGHPHLSTTRIPRYDQ